MSDRTAKPVVKQERKFQDDVGSSETRQVAAGSTPLKLEPDTDKWGVKKEMDIGPTVLYKPPSFPTAQLLNTVKYQYPHSDGEFLQHHHLKNEHLPTFA